MAQISAEFVERYQIEYQKNPRSRVFAPLAEAYRKMGLLDEAVRVCEKGILHHPEFAGGRVAYAKILMDLKKVDEALVQTESAVRLSPDNLLAHTLMGEALLQLRRPKDALKAFKTVLLLNPNDQKANSIVKKWEFLSAEEYDDDLFEIEPGLSPSSSDEPIPARVERAVSLADAFTVRGDHDRAFEVLSQARAKLGPSPEIEKRLRLLAKKTQNSSLDDLPEIPSAQKQSQYLAQNLAPNQAIETETESLEISQQKLKKLKLETFLQRINERRFGG